MNKTTQKAGMLSKLYCNLFGHDFEVTKKVTYHVKEYKCCHCKKELTTNGNGNLTELTPKFREINSILERVYARKMTRLKRRPLYPTSAA